MKAIKPTLVLTLVTTVIAALLVFTYNLTYVDTSNEITDKIQECCEKTMGKGVFEIVPDWKAAGYAIDKPENVEKLIVNENGDVAFEIITSGYSKNGLDLLIALNKDGTVKGISVISLSETPGLGTKVNDDKWLSAFEGVSAAKIAGGSGGGFYKGEQKTDEIVDATAIKGVTSATYSSKGVIEAVNIATSVFIEMGGAK